MTVIDAETEPRPSTRTGVSVSEEWGGSSLLTQTLALTGRSVRPYLQPGVLIVTFIEPLVMLLMFGGVLRALGDTVAPQGATCRTSPGWPPRS